jgi:hypothetical protein
VHGHDYPNQFYEDLLMPPGYLTTSELVQTSIKNAVKQIRPTNVQMERSYIKSWRDFYNLTANVEETIAKLIDSHVPDQARFVESNVSALRALSVCKFSAPNLRKKLYTNILGHRDKLRKIEESQVLIDGLMGIAHGNDRCLEAM